MSDNNPPGDFPPPQNPTPNYPPPGTPPPATPPPSTPPPAQNYPPAQGYPPPGTPPPGYPQQPGYQNSPPGVDGAPPLGAPPPGYPVADQAPKKKSKALLVLGIIFAIIVLGVGACGVIFWRFAAGPVDATNEYLALLDEQRFQEAYDAFAPSCQVQERGDFVASVSTLDITDYNISSFDVTNGRAHTSGSVTFGDGTENDAAFNLIKVDGDWAVCGFEINPIAAQSDG